MEHVNIRFASVFLCPAPCRAEVLVGPNSVAKCPSCGKEFVRTEVTDLLLSQGRFFKMADGNRSSSPLKCTP